MTKKLLIILAIIVPTVVLTSLLLLNKDKLGNSKEWVTETFRIEGMVCADCEGRVRSAFKGTNVRVISVDYNTKEANIQYDKGLYDLQGLNEKLAEEDLSASTIPDDTLEVLDYNIRYN